MLNNYKRHLIILIAFLILNTFLGYSYETPIDSILKMPNEDKQIKLLYQHANSLKRNNSDRILKIAKILDEKSKKSNTNYIKVLSHSLYAKYYRFNHEYGKSIKYCYAVLNECSDTSEACIDIKKSIANTLEKGGRFDQAIKYRHEILSYYKKTSLHYKTGQAYRIIGEDLISLDKTKQAVKYYKKYVKVTSKTLNTNRIAKAYNGLGYSYEKNHNLDSALSAYTKGLSIIQEKREKTRQDTLLIGLISGNIGGIHKDLGNNKKALALLETDRKYNAINGYPMSSFYSSIEIAEIYLNTDKKEMALETLNEAEKHINKITLNHLPLYKSYVNVYHSMKNWSKSDYYFKKYSFLNDSLQLSFIDEQKQIQEALLTGIFKRELDIQKIEVEKNKQKITSLKQKEELTRYKASLIIIISITIIISLTLFFMNYYSRIKKRNKLQEIQHKLTKKEVEHKKKELNTKNSQLTYLALDISRKNDFTTSLITKLKSLKKGASSETVIELNNLMIYVRNEMNINESLVNLQTSIAEINSAFFEKLSTEYSNLTKSEKYLCGLLRLELSNQEIAILRNVSTNSIKVAKNRLRRKMKLAQRTNLSDYLRKL